MKITMYPRSNHPAPWRTAVLLLGLFLIGILPAGAAAQDTAIEPAVTLVNWLVINQPGTYILDHDLSGVTYGVVIASSDVVLDGTGHAITGAGADGSAGILVTGPPFTPVTNVTVRNVVVQHWDDGIHIAEAIDTTLAHAIAEENVVGLRIDASRDSNRDHRVLDSTFRENTGSGLSLSYPAKGIAIERCSITGNGLGIDADTVRSTDSITNHVAECEISGNAGDGLASRDGSFSVIRDCTVSANGDDGLEFEHGGAEIVGCHIERNTAAGLHVSDRGGSDIHGNWIAGNGVGILAGGDWPSRVRNNYLNNTDNGFFGVPFDSYYLNYPKTAGENIVGGPYLGGNFWANPDGTGFSQTHPDADHDGICDEPYHLTEDATDYLPLAPWSGPGPTVKQVPGGIDVPTDTNDDGKYDDVNGNHVTDFNDLVLYFNSMEWITANEPLSAFDYNSNGGIDFADIVWLFNHMG